MPNLTTKLSTLSKLACLGMAMFTAACGDPDAMDAMDADAEDEAVFQLDDVVLYAVEAEFAEEIERVEHDLEVEEVTEIGEVWQEDCNLCVLTKTGAICTAQKCEDFDPDLASDVAATCEDGEYYEGEIWMKSCNMCKCTDMGTVCTLKECDPDSIPH